MYGQEGTYATDNPNIRVVVEVDYDFYDDPDYAPGVREELIKAHEEGNVYGVILKHFNTYETVYTDEVTGETRESSGSRWIVQDSIWSCAGYENVAEEVAAEFFGVRVIGKVGE